jgi:hypothetical protein
MPFLGGLHPNPNECPIGKKTNSEVLLQLLNNQHPNEQRLVQITYPEAYENTCNTEENMAQVSTDIEILLQMSDKTLSCNTLTRAEEYMVMRSMHLKSEIAQLELSDHCRSPRSVRIISPND